MRLDGLASLTMDGGGGAADQLYVYGESEDAIIAGTLDVFGFGAGVIIPGQGVGNAYDEVLVNDSIVRFVDSAQAAVPTDVLLPVTIATPSFVQPNELTFGLIVNAGYEADPPPIVNPGFPLQVADDIIAMISDNFSIQINGGDPIPPFAPDGDRLNIRTFTDVNIFSDKSSPPVVSATTSTSPFSVGFSSIEFALFSPGNGQVNLIGDNNDPAIDQNDNFIVVGQDVDGDGNGQNEFSLRINGDTMAPNLPALYFENVDDLNVFGDDQNPPPGFPSAGNDIDTLEITPYADDTPRGWGIDVSFNEGNPPGSDGAQADLIIYNTAAFGGQVSEAIVVRPAGTDHGEIVVTNLGFGTPIVDIDYTFNTDIIFNDNDGFLNDTDTLTLLGSNPDNPGTSGNETFNVDFTAAGGVGTQNIIVQDGPAILYAIRQFNGFDSIDIKGLDGDDTVNYTPDALNVNAALNAGNGLQNVVINYDGGDPVASDTLTVNANAGARITQGAISTSGVVDQLSAGNVNYSNVEVANVNSATADSTLIVRGTHDNDTIALAPASTATRVWINDGTVVTANAGSSNFSTVTLQGRFGDDSFSITPSDVDVNVEGGDPTASDTVTVNGSAAQNNVNFTPTGSDSGTVDVTGFGSVTLSTVESLTYSGLGGNDNLTVTTPAGAQLVNYLTGPVADAGSVLVSQGGLVSQLPLHFQDMGINGNVILSDADGVRADTLEFVATDLADVINVTAVSGNVQAFNAAGVLGVYHSLVVQTPGIATAVLAGGDGDDVFNVPGDHPFTATFGLDAIEIEGGQPDSGSDVLNFTGSGAGAVTLDLAAQTITEAGFGPVGYAGIETINIDANNTLTVDGTADNDVFNVTPINADNDGSFEHSGSLGVLFNYDDATTVTFNGGGGVDELNILGDNAADAITSAASAVTVDGSTVTLGTDLELLQVLGLGGDDNIDLSALVFAGGITILGDEGDDVLTGSAQGDVIGGGAGNDFIRGLSGIDNIDGGAGNDVIIGGLGNDLLFGGADSDTFIWDPGDNNDLMEGGTGEDALAFNGGVGNDDFTMSENGTRLRFERQPGGVVLDVADVENVDVNRDMAFTTSLDGGQEVPAVVTAATGTADIRFNAIDNTFSVDITALGLTAADITGFHLHSAPAGANGGVIVGFFSPGDATFLDVPGGVRLVATNVPFRPTADPAVEVPNLLAGNTYLNVHTTANPGGEIRGQVMVDLAAAFSVGGADTFTVHDLDATSVRSIDLNVDAPAGPADGLVDNVTLHGDSIADDVNISVTDGVVNVVGLSTQVDIYNASIAAASDVLTIEGNEGDDAVDVQNGVQGLITTTLNGGVGEDSLTGWFNTANGGAHNDTIIGAANDQTLNGDAGDDTLDGRGGTNTSLAASQSDTILVSGTAGPDAITTNHTPGAPSTFNITGGLSAGMNNLPGDDIETVRIESGGADDTIVVNAATAGNINYVIDGGEGSDIVTMQGGPDVDEVIYSPGPSVTDGRLSYEDAGDNTLFTMDFTNLEPVVDLIGAVTLTVNGTGSDNAFSYSQGTAAANGLVSVDGFETIEFSNKMNLVLNGHGGSDEFSLNNPSTPTGLTGITVNGGDPTAGSDVAIISGTTGADAIDFAPTTDADAVVTGAGPVVITLATIENAVIDGQGDTGDTLTYTSPAGEDHITLDPGSVHASGTITASARHCQSEGTHAAVLHRN